MKPPSLPLSLRRAAAAEPSTAAEALRRWGSSRSSAAARYFADEHHLTGVRIMGTDARKLSVRIKPVFSYIRHC